MNQNSESPTAREPIRTREVTWATIALFLAVSTGMLVLLIRARYVPSLAPVVMGPSWRENLTLFGSLLVVAVGGVIVGIGRLRAADLELGRPKLVEGVIIVGAVWLLIQILAALEGAISGSIAIARTWSTVGVEQTLLWTAVMFLATATYEEIAFRGFLFPQLYLKFGGSHRERFWTSLLVSQFLFAIAHIPAHIAVRHLAGSALWTTVTLQGVVGVVLLLLYLRTRNLWINIGFHGLANAPTPLFKGSIGWEIILIALLVGWPWLTRRPSQRGLARVESLDQDTRTL